MWDLKLDTRRLVEGFSTSILWERPNVLWNKADDWWNDNYVTDPSTAAFLSATGIIDPNKQNYVNNLVIALKNQGLWNKMKAIYPFVSEQRNLLNNTEDFSDWSSAGGGPLTTNYGLAPNNTLTADRFQGTSSSRACRYISVKVDIGVTYTFSLYVKSLSGTQKIRIGADNSCGISQFAQTFTVDTSWTRVSATFTSTQTNWNIFFDNIESGIVCTGTYLNMDILIWGVQLELGSTATDYQTTINAQEQFAAAYKYNLKDPQDTDAAFRLKIFGTWTFTPTGAKPNGTNAYMDTLLNPVVQSISESISIYARTAESGVLVPMGAKDNNKETYIGPGLSTLNIRGTLGTPTGISPSTKGFICIFDTDNSTNQYSNINGIQNTGTRTFTGSPNFSFYLGALNNYSIPSFYSTIQLSFAHISDRLNSAEALAFYTIVQQFQTNLNRQV